MRVISSLGLLCATAEALSSPQLNPPKNGAGVDRRESLAGIATSTLGASSLFLDPLKANADVSDGNSLPQGAAQFARVVRLQSDLKGVKKRVTESASEIDKKEWDNISKFLRATYSTGDDMKAVANGIYNPDNKKRALGDIDQLRKYTQAADLSVNKQDGPGFVAVADKMEFYVSDFLDSLSDVPDEI